MNFPRVLSVLVLVFASQQLSAEINLVDKKGQKLGLKGFVKFDATFQESGMNSLTAPRFATGGNGETNFTAMHSRFALVWKGPETDGGLGAGAILEWDLFDGSRNQMRFRTRLAALTLAKGGSTWTFGQHWDVFSPLNVKTLMTNGNLWQTGNLGFRRSQVRYAFSGDRGEFALSANDPTTDAATDSQLPIFEGRVGLKFAGRGRFGISAAQGVEEHTFGSGTEDVDIQGLSLDWKIPFGKLWTFQGEAATGENLGVFLGRAKVAGLGGTVAPGAQEEVALWGQLVYGSEAFDLWLGYGNEKLDEEGLAPGALESTSLVFGGFLIKLRNRVSLGLEGGFFESEKLGLADKDDSVQLIFSALYTF